MIYIFHKIFNSWCSKSEGVQLRPGLVTHFGPIHIIQIQANILETEMDEEEKASRHFNRLAATTLTSREPQRFRTHQTQKSENPAHSISLCNTNH